jgi:apolipoprotein N-acyltransferase
MLRKVTIARAAAFSVLSAVLLNFSFPDFDIEPLAWFALAPLIFSLRGADKKRAFFYGLLFGVVFFGLGMSWMTNVSVPGYLSLIFILSLFTAFFTLTAAAFSCIGRPVDTFSKKILFIFVISGLWTVSEYLRANLFTGFGWNLLGYSQYLNLPVIQIADLTGAYGVGFLIMAVNAAVYLSLRDALSGNSPLNPAGLCVILFLLLSLFYGYNSIGQVENSREPLCVAVIQGNIPQEQKWDADYRGEIFEKYSSLTKRASARRPDMIIWPETALPGYPDDDDLEPLISELISETGSYLFFGSPTYEYAQGEYIYYNSALLFSPDGELAGEYRKVRLVPFGEYVPFEDKLFFLRGAIDKPIGNFRRGEEHKVFTLEKGEGKYRFSALICYEDIFPSLVRRFAQNGAEFLVNMTNDAWFGRSAAPYQHAQASVFRAVENRLPVVRAANTGLSCFIDKTGRITETVKSDEGREIFTEGYATGFIHAGGSTSFYASRGDVFVYLLFIMLPVCSFVLRKTS